MKVTQENYNRLKSYAVDIEYAGEKTFTNKYDSNKEKCANGIVRKISDEVYDNRRLRVPSDQELEEKIIMPLEPLKNAYLNPIRSYVSSQKRVISFNLNEENTEVDIEGIINNSVRSIIVDNQFKYETDTRLETAVKEISTRIMGTIVFANKGLKNEDKRELTSFVYEQVKTHIPMFKDNMDKLFMLIINSLRDKTDDMIDDISHFEEYTPEKEEVDNNIRQELRSRF